MTDGNSDPLSSNSSESSDSIPSQAEIEAAAREVANNVEMQKTSLKKFKRLVCEELDLEDGDLDSESSYLKTLYYSLSPFPSDSKIKTSVRKAVLSGNTDSLSDKKFMGKISKKMGGIDLSSKQDLILSTRSSCKSTSASVVSPPKAEVVGMPYPVSAAAPVVITPSPSTATAIMSSSSKSSSSKASEEGCCKCCPYPHTLIITAQVFASIGFCASCAGIVMYMASIYHIRPVIGFIMFLLGFTAWIMYMVVACCRMNKCGLIVAGVFACIVAIVAIIRASLVLASSDLCDEYYVDYYYDDYYNYYDDDYYYDYTTCQSFFDIAAYVGLAGGFIWTVVAILTFVFVCGPGYAKYHQRQEDTDEEIQQTVQYLQSAPMPNTQSLQASQPGHAMISKSV